MMSVVTENKDEVVKTKQIWIISVVTENKDGG